MQGEAIMAVSVATVALVQLFKWTGMVPDRWGPLAVLLLAALGVGLWAYSRGDFTRETLFDYFAGWIAVATSAAGVYGYTRAAATSLTAMKPPPASGAGSEPTRSGIR